MNMNYLCSQYWPRSSLLKSFKDLCPTLYLKRRFFEQQSSFGSPAKTQKVPRLFLEIHDCKKGELGDINLHI